MKFLAVLRNLKFWKSLPYFSKYNLQHLVRLTDWLVGCLVHEIQTIPQVYNRANNCRILYRARIALLLFLRVKPIAVLISVVVIMALIYFAFQKFLGVRLPVGEVIKALK